MKRAKHNRGFILLTALAMLAIVGVALLALGSAMVYDAKRTMDRSQRAQLDQMLLAGTTDAIEHLKSGVPKMDDSWEVELPDALTQQEAKLTTTVDVVEENQVWMKVHAQLGKHSAQQSIQMTHDQQGWRLVRAEVPL